MTEITGLGFVDRSSIFTGYKAEQMLSQIDKLRADVQRCIRSEQQWREQAHRTREEVAQEIKNEYAEENQQLRDELRFSVASLSSALELERYEDFCKRHLDCRLKNKSTGGKIPYVIQCGTGVGTSTKVYCQVCGASEDITDTSVW